MTRREDLLAGLGLLVLTVLAFVPSLNAPFTHYDDGLYVWTNLERLSPAGWDGLLLQWSSDRAWSGDFVEYFPLRDTVYWALFQAFDLRPGVFHLASIFFHLGASLGVWIFFRIIGIEARAAWLGGLLFALHPVHIESVVWIAALKDPMFTSFMMLGLCSYASYRKRPAAWKYALTLLGLVAGFLCKSIVVAMPFIMLAMEVLLPPRAKWGEVAMRLAGPFVITGLFMMTIMGIGKANHIIVQPHGGSFTSHVVLATWAQVKYLKQAFFPNSYRLIYCFEPPTGLGDWRLWVGVVVFVAVVGLAWRWRRDPLRLLMMAIYVFAILPVSNLVPFPAIMADRYLYAPTIGACGLLALATRNLAPRLFNLVAVAVALMLTVATATRSAVWQDEEALWEEPDMDPACMVDTSFPAAQAHTLRYLTSKDRVEGLMALERAMATPGIRFMGHTELCSTIISAARDSQKLGGDGRTLSWTKQATLLCPNDERAWNAAMAWSIHRNPELAARAATRAWRLSKRPETEVLMWLTLLELGDTRAAANLLRLAQLDDFEVCEKTLLFAEDAPRLAPQLGEAVQLCQETMKKPPKKQPRVMLK